MSWYYTEVLQARQIEAFHAVMRTGSITAGAEAISITQPAVSRLIRDLELELGLALFIRRGNLVVPTTEARALMAEVDRSFIGLGQIREYAAHLRNGRSGSLRIAALPAMASGYLPRFVARFYAERPEVKLLIEGLPSTTIREQVAAGTYDVGLSSFPFLGDTLNVIPFDDPAVVVMPAGHRLAASPTVRAEDLRGERLVLLTKFRGYSHPVERVLQSVAILTSIETSLSSIACVLVAEGAGLAIVDPFSASEFTNHGLVTRALQPELTIGTCLIHASNRTPSLVAKEFIEAFVAHTHRFLAEAACLRT